MFLGIEIGGTKLQLALGDGQSSELDRIVKMTVDQQDGAAGILRQIEYGIDSDLDGSVNEYVINPDQAELENAISARIFMLARTADLDVSYTDARTYNLSNADPYEPADQFRRRVFTTTVGIPNVRNRLIMEAELL